MIYTLGLYEKAMPNALDFREKLELTARCGFDRLEISVDESDEKLARLDYSDKQTEAIARASRASGVPISTMCLSGHRKYPFGSHDPAIVRRSMEIMKKALALGAALGVRIIQLAGYDVYYETHDDGTVQRFFENLTRATEIAAAYGIILGFETMETPFMDTTQKAMEYVRCVNSPYLGIYPDIGNLKNAAVVYGTDVVEDLKTGCGHIFAAHLKETNPGIYRDMMFGSGGHTEYERCIRELCTQGVRMYTGEFWYKGSETYEADICAAAKFLREKINSACEG
mgnify:FL=1